MGRCGAGGQVGPSPLLGHWEPRDGDAFEVGSRAEDTWLVIGQSHNAGWRASIDGRDLGPRCRRT